MENGMYSSASYRTDQITEAPSKTVQDNLSAAIAATIPKESNSEAPVQNYSYTGYGTSTDTYGYGNTGYAGYYSGYQQPQSNQAYTQQQQQQQQQVGGGYQTTGGSTISDFTNTVPYAGPTNYTTTYYNPADYQTPGGAGAGYNYGTQNWQQGSYVNYGNNQYGSYAPEATTVAAPTQQYQQSYNQWADYYSQTEVSCAPGTENVASTGTANAVHSVPGVPGAYVASNTQQPATFAAPWRPESSSSDVTPVQHGAAINNVQDGYWKHGTPTFQTQNVGHVQSNVRPLDSNHTYAGYQEQPKPVHPQAGYQEQHKPVHSQVSGAQYPATHQLPYNYYTSLQTVSQTVQQTVPQSIHQTASQNIPFDSRVSKMQIPTNPRIATNLVLGLPKIEKDNSVSSAAAKPLYVSVAPPKANSEVTSHVGADSILKPGMFPKSLRGYVERALSRCKDDKQMAACQEVMKEVITKATADGTLYTRNWDMEPLFPLPSADGVNNEALQSSTPVSSLTNNRRSPSRRSKSRWEPLSVDKLVDKQSPHTPDTKYSGWFNPSEGGKYSAGRVVKENNWGHLKFTSSDQKVTNRVSQRPAKRQCLGDGPSGGDNGGASSDSDEQSLTAYYAGAVALADTPEEKKRRESRSKRFEKARGNRSANSYSRPKTVGAGLYTKRTNALVLKKDFEEGNSRAVEDIDWDSLTVKGTCQEVEKRYLRLTSAPDPATVRPEEVLEKALLMVQGSQKNYLYKCDQLKSIRQDLTVQRIRNELTVKVYETHARLAIEVGDLSEYNQCQSQLQVLYAEGNKGCVMEFSAYNLLCVILHSNNNRDLLSAMSRTMPRYDDRHGTTRLYVGHLSSRTRSRDLEDVFSRYGRVRDVDMKRDFAFVEFSDSRDADDARHSLNGRDVDGSRIVVEFAKGAPRGPGGSREFLGKGPAPGSGRCFNCGIDGHWARDCKAGDWKNKCYRCGDRGHIEKNCQNSPKKLKRARSYSRTPSPGRGRSRSRSYSRDRSYSRSRSPRKERSVERAERRTRSPRRRRSSPPPTKGRKHSPSPDEQSPRGRATPSPGNSKQGSDYRRRSKAKSRSPVDGAERQSPRRRSPSEENGYRPSPSPREDMSDMSPVDDENRVSPRNSDSG